MRTALLIYFLALGQGWVKCNLFDTKNSVDKIGNILRHNQLPFVKNTYGSRKEELQNTEKQLIIFFQHVLHEQRMKSKMKLSFGLAGLAKGIQFIADVVTIVSSDFWKWIRTVK